MSRPFAYRMSGYAASTHVPEHPERTARRSSGSGMDFDVEFQVWPSRAAMLTTIRMQGRGARTGKSWTACKVARNCTECGKSFIVRESECEFCGDDCYRVHGLRELNARKATMAEFYGLPRDAFFDLYFVLYADVERHYAAAVRNAS